MGRSYLKCVPIPVQIFRTTTGSPTGLQGSAQLYLQQECRGNSESWDRAGIWCGISGMVLGIPPGCQKNLRGTVLAFRSPFHRACPVQRGGAADALLCGIAVPCCLAKRRPGWTRLLPSGRALVSKVYGKPASRNSAGASSTLRPSRTLDLAPEAKRDPWKLRPAITILLGVEVIPRLSRRLHTVEASRRVAGGVLPIRASVQVCRW